MERLLKYFSLALCLAVALSSCDDYLEDETHKNEYTICYYVTYSTIYDFHNIAYVSFTSFFDRETLKYTGKPTQILRQIDGTKMSPKAERVPKGAHVELSTYVDVEEVLPNTKVEISIEISTKGGGSPYTVVAKAEADCPLKDNPLTISYDVPNK
ncbi:MAG: hypothetical protein J5784_05095 [Muribaculaceae bacterium]|nr:hypothetical protein [Muribaculaceae bacterium]